MRSGGFDEAFRRRLAQRGLDATVAGDTGDSPSTVRGREHDERLTAAERRMWTIAQVNPGSTAHVIGIIWWFSDPTGVEPERLAAAVREAAAGTPILQRVIEDRAGARWRRVDTVPGVALVTGDESDARERARRLASRPFDLLEHPPWRAEVVSLPGGGAAVALAVHHIAVDDRSWEVLLNRVLAAYAGRGVGGAVRIGPAGEPSADRARRAALAWDGTGADPLDFVPRRRRSVAPDAGGRIVRTLPDGVLGTVERAARAAGASLFSYTAAVAAIAVHAATGARRVPLTTPVADRGEGLDDEVGYFGNLVPFTVQIDPRATLADAVAAATRAAYRALEFRDVDVDVVAADLRTEGADPLADSAMVAVRTNPARASRSGGPQVRAEPVHNGTSQARLSVTVDLGTDVTGPVIEVDHQYAHVDEETAGAIADLVALLLTAAEDDPSTPVDRLVAADAPGPVVPASPDELETVVALMRRAVADHPGRTAIVEYDADGRTRSLDYAAVGAATDLLAGRLIAGGAPQAPVAVVCAPGAARAIGLAAVWSAGMTAVPIDPAYPPQWVRRVLDTASVHTAIVDGAGAALLDAIGRAGTRMEVPLDGEGQAGPLPAAPHLDALAYIGTTSGSTGAPKLIAVTHRALAARVRWGARSWPLRPGEARVVKSSIGFVDGITEIADGLCAGAESHFLGSGEGNDARRLAAVVEKAGCRHLMAVPTVWEALVRDGAGALSSLDRIVVTGAPAGPDLLEALRSGSRADVRDSYGCAELAGDVVEGPAGDGVIGRSTDGALRVLDRRLRPVRPGLTGVLYVAGDPPARGYAGDAAATAANFVADPFAAGRRMFCTGDLARVRGDGAITLLGRGDDRIKVNGVRVERDEVEAALRERPGVRAAAARVARSAAGAEVLVGFVTASGSPDGAALARDASRALPPGVTVASVHVLGEIPTLPSGKIDYAALPAAAPEPGPRKRPRTESHRIVARIAAAVLGLDAVDTAADLFALGANSMHTVEIGRRASEAGVAVTAADIFEHRTIDALLDGVRPVRAPRSTARRVLPLAPSSRLWTDPARAVLTATRPMPHGTTADRVRARIDELAAEHEALRCRVGVSRRGNVRIEAGDGPAVVVAETAPVEPGGGTLVLMDGSRLVVVASPYVMDERAVGDLADLLARVEPGDERPRPSAPDLTMTAGVVHLGRVKRRSTNPDDLANALAQNVRRIAGDRHRVEAEFRPRTPNGAPVLAPLSDLVGVDEGRGTLEDGYAALHAEWSDRAARAALLEKPPASVALAFSGQWRLPHPVVLTVDAAGDVSARSRTADWPPARLRELFALWSTG